MERIVILSLAGIVAALPAIMAAGCAVSTSHASRTLRVVDLLWGLRALLGLGLLGFWFVSTTSPPGDVGVPVFTLWEDEALPDLVFSFRLDRLTAVFLAWETFLSACAMRRFRAGALRLDDRQRTAWMYGGMLVTVVDLFVLSANLLLTLACGILISRICELMCRGSVDAEFLLHHQGAIGGQAAGGTRGQIRAHGSGTVLRWGEAALWVTLLLAWQFFGTGDYAALCDPLVQQRVASDNPAAIPVLALCLVWVTLAFARQFPFLLPTSVATHGEGDRESPLARELMDLPVDGLLRGFLVWPIGFWILFRLGPVWQHVGVARQLLGLAGAVTAVLAVAMAAVGTNRREILSYGSAAHLGLIAMLFSMGSLTAMFAGLMLIGFDAAVRLLIETMTTSRAVPPRDAPGPSSRSLIFFSAIVILLWGACGGRGFLGTELAHSATLDSVSSPAGLPAAIFKAFPWIVIFVLSGESWSLLRCGAISSRQRSGMSEDRNPLTLPASSWIVWLAGPACVGIFCLWRMDLMQSLLLPLQPVHVYPFDLSMFAIMFSSVSLAAIAVGLLYGLNPEWRNALRKPVEPLLSPLQRGAYLPDVWKLMVWQPAGYFAELCRFCEETAWPAAGRFFRRLISLWGESFLGELEHGNIRVYGVVVLLTTALMLGLLLYPEL
ncbi:MAG: proton-conducting transporter membrane subunit [Planctomycetaceae bacterium]